MAPIEGAPVLDASAGEQAEEESVAFHSGLERLHAHAEQEEAERKRKEEEEAKNKKGKGKDKGKAEEPVEQVPETEEQRKEREKNELIAQIDELKAQTEAF